MKKGFTLIELMIVIAIIIILAAIAIPNYARMQDRAKISAVQSDMKSISTALEAYFTDWGQYPTGDYSNLKAELTANGATLNGSGNKTLTGETGGIVYIKSDAFTALENKVKANNISYDGGTDGGTYTLTVTIPLSGGQSKTFEMTPGGQIVEK